MPNTGPKLQAIAPTQTYLTTGRSTIAHTAKGHMVDLKQVDQLPEPPTLSLDGLEMTPLQDEQPATANYGAITQDQVDLLTGGADEVPRIGAAQPPIPTTAWHEFRELAKLGIPVRCCLVS